MARATQEERLSLALAAADLGTFQWDLASGTTTWDERLEAIFGLPPGGFDGRFETWVALLHPDDRAGVLASLDRAVAERSAYEVRHRIVWPDGSVHWIEGRGQVTVDADGQVTGSIGCSRDVTDRALAELAAAQASWRTSLMQEMTAALASAVTVEQVVAAVSAHAELALQARTGVVFVRERDELVLVGSFGYPVPLDEEYGRVPVTADLPAPESVRLGRTLALRADEFDLRYPHLAELRRDVAGEAVVCAPLLDDEGPIGSLGLTFPPERRFAAEELAEVEVLAAQCALALTRTRLLARTREVAELVQAELAPHPLPQVEGVELAARYRPGGDELEQVGGDWYDVFRVDDRRLCLVVGDVMGRGVAASASMTRVRAALRAYTVVDPTPHVVLGKADRLLARDGRADELVTVLYGTYDIGTGRLVVASAGHLPPVLVGHGVLPVESGSPLGLGGPHVETTVDLEPGAALLLCTDGLVERRDGDVEDGLAALSGIGTAGPLGELVDELVATAGAETDDDVTLLAVRRPLALDV